MGLLVPKQVEFCGALSSLLNFSQRVIGAWCLAEDSGSAAISKAAAGDNNWLNVEAFDSGWSSFATNKEVWATPTRAAQATWNWINTKADPVGLRKVILAARGKSDGDQLAAIINSTWTGNSHYGGGGLIHQTYGELAGFKFPAKSNTGINTQGGGTRGIKETRTLPYEFSRGTSEAPNENSWDCIERLAGEVKWHAWMRNGALWYASDTWLTEQPPKYIIDEFARGIDDLQFNVDTRGQTDDCTFHCEASRYAVTPGDCVLLKNSGPANGPWIVYDVTRAAGTATAEVKIRREVRPLPEPAPQTQSKTITTSPSTGGTRTVPGVGGSGADGLPAKYKALLYWSNQVSSARPVYVRGGGHVADMSTYSIHSPFDCSGAVSYVLYKAGFIPANGCAPSYGMYGWFAPGPGKWFTLWAANGHTFLEFKQGSIFRRFDTVPGCGHDANGPRLWTMMCPEPISGEGAWVQRHPVGY